MAAVNGARAATATLTAATVDTITLTSKTSVFELTHHGDATEPIYFRDQNADPAVAGVDCDVILAGQRLVVSAPGGVLKVISAGVPSYTLAAL